MTRVRRVSRAGFSILSWLSNGAPRREETFNQIWDRVIFIRKNYSQSHFHRQEAETLIVGAANPHAHNIFRFLWYPGRCQFCKVASMTGRRVKILLYPLKVAEGVVWASRAPGMFLLPLGASTESFPVPEFWRENQILSWLPYRKVLEGMFGEFCAMEIYCRWENVVICRGSQTRFIHFRFPSFGGKTWFW
jgi:hypothetical protein